LAGMVKAPAVDRPQDMKRARVLHVIDSLHLGGAQEVIFTLVKGADSTRFEHEVATLHGHGVYWERMRAEGFRLHSLSPSKFLPLYLLRLWAMLRRGNYDVLHCHLGASNIMAKPIGRACRVGAIVSHDHTNDRLRVENRLVFWLDRWANQFADAFVAVSETCRKFLIEAEGIAAEKIRLVANAIDPERYRPGVWERAAARQEFGLRPGDVVLAGVGRLNPQKNFGLLLDVAAELKQANLRVVLAGTGPEEAFLQERATELGLSEQVRLLGYVADTRKVYAAADLLVITSRFEGLPMTLLEAMSSGVPVVAAALDGMMEVIESGKNGWLVKPGDRAGFVAAVREALQDESQRKQLAAAGRETILQRYGAARMVREIEEVYQHLLEEKNS
jgi:glycosyltransferase involved in cell wall biosynthesis